MDGESSSERRLPHLLPGTTVGWVTCRRRYGSRADGWSSLGLQNDLIKVLRYAIVHSKNANQSLYSRDFERLDIPQRHRYASRCYRAEARVYSPTSALDA